MGGARGDADAVLADRAADGEDRSEAGLRARSPGRFRRGAPSRRPRLASCSSTAAVLGPPMPVAWIVSGSPSAASARVPPQPARVVEHPRSVEEQLGERERSAGVAGEQRPRGELRRRLEKVEHGADRIGSRPWPRRRTPRRRRRRAAATRSATAVDQAFQATARELADAGQVTRGRATEIADELVGVTRGRATEIADELVGNITKLRDVLEDARPATAEEIREVRAASPRSPHGSRRSRRRRPPRRPGSRARPAARAKPPAGARRQARRGKAAAAKTAAAKPAAPKPAAAKRGASAAGTPSSRASASRTAAAKRTSAAAKAAKPAAGRADQAGDPREADRRLGRQPDRESAAARSRRPRPPERPAWAPASSSPGWPTSRARSSPRRSPPGPEVERVIGLDTRPPGPDLASVIDHVDADVRVPGPRAAAAPAPHHRDRPQRHPAVPRAGPRRAATCTTSTSSARSALLTAAATLPELEAVVVRGSAAIYGAEPAAPAFWREDDLPPGADREQLRTRFQRDVAEIEQLVAVFARRHPEVACTTLRMQPVVGGELDSPITRLVRAPLVPTYLGFDPRVQVIHLEDATRVLVRAVEARVRGTVNVGAPGPVSLSRALRVDRAPGPPDRRAALRHRRRAAARVGGLPALSVDMARYLRFGRAVDLTRQEQELGLVPERDTLAALLATARRSAVAEAARDGARSTSSGAGARRTRGATTRATPRASSPSSTGSTTVVARPGERRRARPADGPALLVANHAGLLPWDAAMVTTAVCRAWAAAGAGAPRRPRFLVGDEAFELPWLGVGVRRLGGVPAGPANAARLLRRGARRPRLPRGPGAAGKPWADRYRLLRFGRGGFAETAMRAGVPIVPCGIVGGEEAYPRLGQVPALARLARCPSSRSPRPSRCSGPLGLVPLPVAVADRVRGARATAEPAGGGEDRAVVLALAEAVRDAVQGLVHEQLTQRAGAFI